jgi:manganese/zinc/iron transport system substrate-binding protein
MGVITLIVVLTVLLVSKSAHAQDIATRKIKVVATVGMITDVVGIVGGDRVEVAGLMGPGVDPHLYRASASDVQKLSQADIIFYGGLHLEGKMVEILEKLGSKIPTIPVAESVPEKERLDFPGLQGFYDPHVWFDVSYWSLATTAIQDGLAKLDPKNAEAYKQRAELYQAKLALLDQYTKDAIKSIPEGQRVMVTAHDAFHYFGRRYGVEVVALQGVSTEAEAGVEDVRRLADLIATRKIPAIFVESSVPHRTIEAVQEAVKARGWDVKIGGQLFSDAMGDAGTLEGTYIGMILHNDTILVTALGGKMPTLPEGLADYQPVVDRGMAFATLATPQATPAK